MNVKYVAAYLLMIKISLILPDHMHQAYHMGLHLWTDVHHTLSLALVIVILHGLILKKIKVNLDFLIGGGFLK
jgi:hypothetical protein